MDWKDVLPGDLVFRKGDSCLIVTVVPYPPRPDKFWYARIGALVSVRGTGNQRLQHWDCLIDEPISEFVLVRQE